MANTVTEQGLMRLIIKEAYVQVGQKTTICCLTLKNGFEVIGESACVDPANFNEELGRKYSHERAFNKLWELEGYRLQSEKDMTEKMLDISEVKQAKVNISDLKVYGDGDTFQLLCKASSQEQGWMKSTKVCNVHNGCIVQVTTQQRNPDGSYAVAEALTFVPEVIIDNTSEPRKLVPIMEY